MVLELKKVKFPSTETVKNGKVNSSNTTNSLTLNDWSKLMDFMTEVTAK